VPVCGGELPGQHPCGGKPQTAAEDLTGNESTGPIYFPKLI